MRANTQWVTARSALLSLAFAFFFFLFAPKFVGALWRFLSIAFPPFFFFFGSWLVHRKTPSVPINVNNDPAIGEEAGQKGHGGGSTLIICSCCYGYDKHSALRAFDWHSYTAQRKDNSENCPLASTKVHFKRPGGSLAGTGPFCLGRTQTREWELVHPLESRGTLVASGRCRWKRKRGSRTAPQQQGLKGRHY